jgi:hypothetical protein
LSNNLEAANQILASSEVDLDVNYCHPTYVGEDLQQVRYPLTSLAVLVGMDTIALELLIKGADLMQCDSWYTRTVLLTIIERGGKELMDFVLEHASDVSWNKVLTREYCAYKALHVAAR